MELVCINIKFNENSYVLTALAIINHCSPLSKVDNVISGSKIKTQVAEILQISKGYFI